MHSFSRKPVEVKQSTEDELVKVKEDDSEKSM